MMAIEQNVMLQLLKVVIENPLDVGACRHPL